MSLATAIGDSALLDRVNAVDGRLWGDVKASAAAKRADGGSRSCIF